MDIRDFAESVLTLCKNHDASVTSWIRSRSRNYFVGGKPESKHLLGLAADLVCDRPQDVPLLVDESFRMGLFALDEGTHVHVQVPRSVMHADVASRLAA